MAQFQTFSDPSVPSNPIYWVAAFKQFGSFQDNVAGPGVTITYAFKESGNPPGNPAIARVLSQQEKDQILDAINKISQIANVTFVLGDPTTAELVFAATNDLEGPTGTTFFPGGGKVEVWAVNPAANSYIYKHEVLHGLGLSHSSAVFGAAPPVLPDAEDDGTTLFGNWSGGYQNHYQLFDIAALQYLYGPPNLRTGNDTYSLNPGVFNPASPQIGWPLLWDGGGFDTLDYSAFAVAVNISLVPGELSRIGGAAGGILTAGVFSINYRTVIEAAIGGSANDTLTGNSADNTLRGRAGNDAIAGGGGIDRAVFAGVRSAYSVVAGAGFTTVTGPDGSDTLTGIELLVFDDVTVAVTGGSENVGGPGPDTLVGTGSDDNLTGNGGNDTIVSQAGDDTVDGGDGDDRINAGAGNDVAFGGSGNDEIGGGPGDDTIVGQDGNDIIFGEDGIDVANGGAGADIMVGGLGNDTFGGGADNDIIVGGDGDDLLFGEDGVDNMNGEFGNDGVVGGAGNDILGGGAGNDIVVGDDGDDVLFGETGNDAMNGGFGNDILIGSDGDDVIGGGAGDDDLNGGFGNDTLFGENGNDILNGSAGDDVLIGGGNDDVFVFGPGDGADTIADFFAGAPEDRIWFVGTDLHSFADVQSHATTVSGNAVITYNGFFTVTLNGVTAGQLTAGDFIFT